MEQTKAQRRAELLNNFTCEELVEILLDIEEELNPWLEEEE